MTDPEFEAECRSFIRSKSHLLVETIPAGSGIVHLANVAYDNWIPGYVSTNEGRWNAGGSPVKYYADKLSVCCLELGYTSGNPPLGKTVELWSVSKSVAAINVSRMPEYLREPLYESRGPAPDKWARAHIPLDIVKNEPSVKGIEYIYAPSASGQAFGTGGMCFVASPLTGSIKHEATYKYEDLMNGSF